MPLTTASYVRFLQLRCYILHIFHVLLSEIFINTLQTRSCENLQIFTTCLIFLHNSNNDKMLSIQSSGVFAKKNVYRAAVDTAEQLGIVQKRLKEVLPSTQFLTLRRAYTRHDDIRLTPVPLNFKGEKHAENFLNHKPPCEATCCK